MVGDDTDRPATGKFLRLFSSVLINNILEYVSILVKLHHLFGYMIDRHRDAMKLSVPWIALTIMKGRMPRFAASGQSAVATAEINPMTANTFRAPM